MITRGVSHRNTRNVLYKITCSGTIFRIFNLRICVVSMVATLVVSIATVLTVIDVIGRGLFHLHRRGLLKVEVILGKAQTYLGNDVTYYKRVGPIGGIRSISDQKV